MALPNYHKLTKARRHELSKQPHTHRITLPRRYEGYTYREGDCWRLELYGPDGSLRRYQRCATYDESESLALDIANNALVEV